MRHALGAVRFVDDKILRFAAQIDVDGVVLNTPQNLAHVEREWSPDDLRPLVDQVRGHGLEVLAIENTPQIHNLVVCTLCSCYPWPVLGLPPAWYKSAPFRARAVIDPRGVLADFGVVLPADTEVRVWDSTAEIRYLVLPQRPSGTEALSEEQLAALVTRDSMIGTGLALVPGAPQ